MSEDLAVPRSETEQREAVPSEVPQDTRRPIEDMVIGQLRVKSEVREVQGVSLDADKRELQRQTRDSAEYHFRDKQVEASDALIDEVGALLTESGGAQIVEICSTARFTAKAGDLGLRPGFAVDLCENKPYGPHEGVSWDLSKASDVKELFEMIAFERAVIVTGSPPCTAFSQLQNWSWYPEWEKWQAMKLLHVAVDVYEEQIRAGCMGIPCNAKDQRCFHCILTDALLSSEDRDEEWFERYQQVRVQADEMGDKFEGVGGSLGSQMFEQQWATFSQTHCDGWRNSQDGFCVRTRACEKSASSTTTADVG